MKKILIIDTNNIFWLSRGSHTHEGSLAGGWPISNQFFIIFNSYIRIHQPDAVFILGEGYPDWRFEKFKEYKEGRAEGRAADVLNEDFMRQKKDVREILKKIFPIYYLQHSRLEADDIAYLICKYVNKNNIDSEIICLSTDKDWEQNMVYFDNVKIFQPVTKKWKSKPDGNFVKIKAITGDASDGIPGFKGIGEKTAMKFLTDEKKWNEWWKNLTDDDKNKYERNLFIIDFNNIPEELENEIFEKINSYELPNLQWDYFKVYLRERKNFQFMNKLELKELHFKNLGPIIQHKIKEKNLFEDF